MTARVDTQAAKEGWHRMSATERRKGAAGEREVAAIFRAHGFDCDRTPNSGGLRLRGDLYGNVPVHVEVKRQETLRLPLWLRQAEAECGELEPVVAFRQSRGRWYAALPLETLAELLEETERARHAALAEAEAHARSLDIR